MVLKWPELRVRKYDDGEVSIEVRVEDVAKAMSGGERPFVRALWDVCFMAVANGAGLPANLHYTFDYDPDALAPWTVHAWLFAGATERVQRGTGQTLPACLSDLAARLRGEEP